MPPRLLGHPQMHDQPRGVVPQFGVVRREPRGEQRPGRRAEVRRHGALPGVEDGQDAGEVFLADAEEVVHQVDDPRAREAVHAAGPAVLGRFPPHQRVQHLGVALVVDEPHLAEVAAQPAFLLQGGLGDARVGAAQPLRVRDLAVAVLQVDHRGRERARDVAGERLLLLHQMIELEDRQAAGPQELLDVPGDTGPVHQGLTVGETQADGPADADVIALVREEADRFPALVQHRHLRAAAVTADAVRELRCQKRVRVVRRLVHRLVPGLAERAAELLRSVDRDVRLAVGSHGRPSPHFPPRRVVRVLPTYPKVRRDTNSSAGLKRRETVRTLSRMLVVTEKYGSPFPGTTAPERP